MNFLTLRLSILLLFLGIIVKAQNTPLIGKWEFVQFVSDSTGELEKSMIMGRLMQGQVYEFDAARYRMTWKSRVELGDYFINDSSQLITLLKDNSPLENVKGFHIMGLDTFSLHIEGKAAGSMVFAKIDGTLPAIPKGNLIETVVVQKEQLLKKWKLDSIYGKAHSDSASALISEEVEKFLTSHFARQYHSNGTYVNHTKLEFAKGEGTWELGAKGDAIIMDKGEYFQKNFLIAECSDNRLVLVDHTHKRWCFSGN